MEFVHPFPGKKPGDDVSRQEVISAVRLAACAEQEAIHLYDTISEYVSDDMVKKIMKDVANEEQVHLGEFRFLLQELEEDEKEKTEEGEKEAEEKISSSIFRKNVFADMSPDDMINKGLVEETITADDEYMVLGIPEEYGEWFIVYSEGDDGRGGFNKVWDIVQMLDGKDGDIWESKPSLGDAYDWVMKNYGNRSGQQQAKPKDDGNELDRIREDLYDLYHPRLGYSPTSPGDMERTRSLKDKLHTRFRELTGKEYMGANRNVGIRRWASGWNTPRLPGQVFASRWLLIKALKK